MIFFYKNAQNDLLRIDLLIRFRRHRNYDFCRKPTLLEKAFASQKQRFVVTGFNGLNFVRVLRFCKRWAILCTILDIS